MKASHILAGMMANAWRGALAGVTGVGATAFLAGLTAAILWIQAGGRFEHRQTDLLLSAIILGAPPALWLFGAIAARALGFERPWLFSLLASVGGVGLDCTFIDADSLFPGGNPWPMFMALPVVAFTLLAPMFRRGPLAPMFRRKPALRKPTSRDGRDSL